MGDATQLHLAHSNWSGIQLALSKRTAADLLFVCKDGQVATHRLLLIRRSDVLMEAFDKENNCMNKIKFSFEPTTVLLPDFAKRDVSNLISLLYTGKVDFGEIGEYNSLLQVVEALKLDFGELTLKINTGFNPARRSSQGFETDGENSSVCSEVHRQVPSDFVQVNHDVGLEMSETPSETSKELFVNEEMPMEDSSILSHSIFDTPEADEPIQQQNAEVDLLSHIERREKELMTPNADKENEATFQCNHCQTKSEDAKSFKFHLAMKHPLSIFNLGKVNGWLKKDDETDNFLCLLCKDSIEPRSQRYTGKHLGLMHNKVLDLLKPRMAKRLKMALKKMRNEGQGRKPSVQKPEVNKDRADHVPAVTSNDYAALEVSTFRRYLNYAYI